MNRQESSPAILVGLGEHSSVSPASAVARMGAASAIKRDEMKHIIGSMRRDRQEYTRERSSNNLEETVHRFDENRKNLLLKWQAMSEQRKSSRMSSSRRMLDQVNS